MQTGIKLQWEIEGHDACYLGSAKMEWKMYSPSTLGCQGSKTNRGEEGGGRGRGGREGVDTV